MSAYLCGNCHLTVLAVYAYETKDALALGTTQAYFQLLYDENIKSLQARYPGEPWWNTDPPHLCWFCVGEEFSAFEILKAARSYEYEACEHSEYVFSQAKALVGSIRLQALAAAEAELAKDGQLARAQAVKTLRLLGIQPTGEALVMNSHQYQSAPCGVRKHRPIAELLEVVQAELDDRINMQTDAIGDILDATERYIRGRTRELDALATKAALMGASAYHVDLEYPANMRRFLHALNDLLIPRKHADGRVTTEPQTQMIRELDRALPPPTREGT